LIWQTMFRCREDSIRGQAPLESNATYKAANSAVSFLTGQPE
jgi:hypothetical protein